MSRRQGIAAALAVLLVVANGAVWYIKRQPSKAPPNTREILRDQLTPIWEDLTVRPLSEAEDALAETFRASEHWMEGRDASGFGHGVAHRPLNDAEKADLIDAMSGALAAIAAADPGVLASYMTGRAMKPNPREMKRVLGELDAPSAAATNDPKKLLAAIKELRQADAHWSALAPGATMVNVWKPRSMRNISMVQLGRTESWIWGNQSVYQPLFAGSPTFEQVCRREPPLLADIRVLIEHDDALDHERSPYFFRFWYSEEPRKWQPLALKLVRTAGEGAEGTPVIFF